MLGHGLIVSVNLYRTKSSNIDCTEALDRIAELVRVRSGGECSKARMKIVRHGSIPGKSVDAKAGHHVMRITDYVFWTLPPEMIEMRTNKS